MRAIQSPIEGTVVTKIPTREFRTRHGDVVQIALKDIDIKIEGAKDKTEAVHIPPGAVMHVAEGSKIKKGDKIAEFEPASQGDAGRLTEKAHKDITSDISGEVVFENFVVDEKKDRQGNISRTSNKSGIVWVLGGDVYTLPAGSKVLVSDGQKIKKGEKLAETLVVPEHGGEVRVGSVLKIEEVKFEGRTIKKIVSGKELTIVIASIQPANATFEATKKEQIWSVEEAGDKYIVKCPIDTTVENGMIIAELIDEEHRVSSSGEIRYNGIEVDENQVITKAGEVVFVPEEIHQISKDSSLKLVESGTFVEAGSEVVKDLYTHIDGIVEIKEFNDIIHEVVIRPGELHTLESINDLKVDEGEVVKAGTVVAGKIKAKVDSVVTIVESDSHDMLEMDDLDEELGEDIVDEEALDKQSIQILIRPIQRFMIEPKDASIKFDTTDENIEILPLTQLQYKDGARVRNLDGAVLTRTSLVLSMAGHLSHLKGLVELDKSGELKIVVLETLIVRREQEGMERALSSTQTELLVEDGQIIEPRTPVAKTQVLSVNNSVASIANPEKELRRLLLISENYEEKIELKSKPTVKKGSFVRLDGVISASGEISQYSGRVVKVDDSSISIRLGRPHLISQGALLQIDNSALILRGDLLATLVYEKQKTGDIVQGLPRVEELLEARKPKDSAIAAEEDGIVEIEQDEDGHQTLYIMHDEGRVEVKVPIESSIIVHDKQKVTKGQALTSGPMNPHDVVRLRGSSIAQQYLVDEVQRVYRSQGVEIADKHVEVIVHQMIKKVKIVDSGTTRLLPGELVELNEIEAHNANVNLEEGGAYATYEALLLGITKASLNTESFISAASFQETTRILTEAAVEGKRDMLRGLKENVIIGRLIPAGTGYYHLINSSEEKEKEAIRRASQKNQVRKPSAILEEIEGMFGTPDFSIE
jgi:DNA-directed RNA polymerase subunit beta'